MIAVDTSAIMAVLLRESEAAACIKVLEAENETLISAGTLVELLVVATPRNIAAALVERLEIEIVPVTAAVSRRVGEAHARWRKGIHRAALNFGKLLRLYPGEGAELPLALCGG